MTAPVYGSDTSTSGVSYHPGVIVSEVVAIAEALERRWTCPRGRLLGEPDYGLSPEQYLSGEMTPDAAAALAGDFVAEGEKDDRVQSIDATPSIVGIGASLSIEMDLDVTLVSGQTFSLTAVVKDLTVQILGVNNLVVAQ